MGIEIIHQEDNQVYISVLTGNRLQKVHPLSIRFSHRDLDEPFAWPTVRQPWTH